MRILPVTQEDYEEIVDVWEASVRATHDFISEEDITFFRPLILNEYLAAVDLRAAKDERGAIHGFVGVDGRKIEMLFLAPEAMGKGLGRRLLDFAVREMGAVAVDVNEQNPNAVAFYEHCGFKVVSRSPLDGLGNPFPILHMKLEEQPMPRPLLDPTKKHPMVMPDGTVVKTVVHLNQVVNHPRIEIGDFSYYHNFEELDDYATFMAPYLFPISPEKLVIGKFCQFAHGVRFITSSANHDMNGFSTYPFNNFTMTPATTIDDIRAMFDVPGKKGDTVVGNDVWMGMDALILPGVTIGDGAIISARSVVAKDVEPYTIVGGNPARFIKKRFDEETIQALHEIQWWNWPLETIEANIDAITGANLEALRKVAASAGDSH